MRMAIAHSFYPLDQPSSENRVVDDQIEALMSITLGAVSFEPSERELIFGPLGNSTNITICHLLN